jgi:hypothetical protein
VPVRLPPLALPAPLQLAGALGLAATPLPLPRAGVRREPMTADTARLQRRLRTRHPTA